MESNLPIHIGIIMDGNRSWARAKGLEPSLGHKKGAEVLEEIVKYSAKIGIKYLTVYAFSTENWKRAQTEIDYIMLLLKQYIDRFSETTDDLDIKLNILGDITRLPKPLMKSIEKMVAKTKNNTGMVFNIALNYGGRDDILKSVKDIAMLVKKGDLKIEDITNKTISSNLYTAGQPDPDLIIRTSGEQRLSNFLTWQSSYSELYFTKTLWPDFNEESLDEAINEYNRRTRKFGK